MALKVVNTESLDAVANAINSKSGRSGALQFPEGFVEAVEGISAGGGGENKLPSIIDRTVTELTAEDFAGATKIGGYAFYACENLESVTIPQQVNSIGEYAFYKCYALNSIVFETEELERIYASAFYYCSALKSVKLPKTNYMDSGVFYYCKALESADLSKASGTYGAQTFMYDSALKTVLLGQGTSIPRQMFYECSALENLVVPNMVTSIGENAFYKCSMLEFIDLTGLYRILPTLSNTNAFTSAGISTPKGTFEIRVSKGRKKGLSSMTNWAACADNIVEVGDEEIPDWHATEGLGYTKQSNYCISIGIGTATATDLVIAQFVDEMPVTQVRQYAFDSNKNITSIVIPRTVTEIGNYAFSRNPQCTSVQVLGPLHTVGDSIFFQLTGMTSLTLAEGIEKISRSMFSDCSSLPSVAIPSTVTSIGEYAFQYCKKLEFVDLTAYGNDVPFPIIDGTQPFTNCGTSTASGTFEIRVPSGRKAELAAMTNWSTYADNIVEVSAEPTPTEGLAYSGNSCTGIGTATDTDIVIASEVDGTSITTIEASAFRGCKDITSVYLPNSITNILNDAFRNCEKLTSISIPSGVKTIYGGTFSGCYYFEYIDLTSYGADGQFPTLINPSAFTDCGMYKGGTFKIRVPSGRKAELSAMTNWSEYADNIVEV